MGAASKPRRRARLMDRVLALALALGAVCILGCERTRETAPAADRAQHSAAVDSAAVDSAAVDSAAVGSAAAAPPAPVMNSAAPPPSASAAAPPAPCPDGMQEIPGGQFWVGREHGPKDESPRFRTTVARYCLDTQEVTTAEYHQCVASGACTAAHGQQKTCNGHRKDRDTHPINCVDWEQADAYCRKRGKRLPTELEWEYAARGGEQYRTYSWGEEDPDGRTCWKQPHSCAVGSFGKGAFGLDDMTGNVWEWTSSWYAQYPWPGQEGRHKVYRGGSWSRRFTKWMVATLRNRLSPKKWGSHLGFRCALTPPQTQCPFGKADSGCLHGVLDLECKNPEEKFNGARCARPDEPRCPEGSQEVPGFGCVGPRGTRPGAAQLAAAEAAAEGNVVRARSPQFDTDCQAYQPTRPIAYRFTGGTHVARNHVGKQLGCKNRDVGVGWNSACCPK